MRARLQRVRCASRPLKGSRAVLGQLFGVRRVGSRGRDARTTPSTIGPNFLTRDRKALGLPGEQPTVEKRDGHALLGELFA